MEYTAYNLGHDEWDNSTQALRNWLWAKDPKICWRMPLSFGPMPGPRQDPAGKFRGEYFSNSVTASIKIKTSRTFLQNMFPVSSFSFQSPDTVAYATISCTTLKSLDWLGGGGYSHIGLYLHGVKHTQRDGSVVNGTYLPVLFEDLADPIITGRDELGMSKIYCSIDIDRQDKFLQIMMGWRGVTFGQFMWKGLELFSPSREELDQNTSEPQATGTPKDDGLLAYRYIPAVGDSGKADAEYAVFIPHDKKEHVRETTLKATESHISFSPHDWSALPTLHNVAASLAELPVYDIVEAKVVDHSGVSTTPQAVRLD